jgi:formylglycine-generating enzyme required for sulfatase activity
MNILEDSVMESKRNTVAIVLVIIVLLVIGGLLYQRSLEREQEVQEKGKTAHEAPPVAARPEIERRDEGMKIPEAPAPPPEQAPAAPSPVQPPPMPAELATPDPPPPQLAKADCRPEAPAIVKRKAAAAPEGMVYVPGGAFVMGSAPDAGLADEAPAHTVCLTGFYIDKHEVTNAQFKTFVNATTYVTDAERDPSAAGGRTWQHPYGPDSNADDMPNHPVVCVSWNDANAYAQWAGKRLPTEAEWEKAARGPDARTYPWGNAEPTGSLANVADKTAGLKWSNNSIEDNHKTAAPVGSFPGGKSVYGIEDMAGNVWEWCFDWWDAGYYATSPSQNPAGPESGEFRVIRGGSWMYGVRGAQATHRMYFRPTGSSASIGFRCVKDAR